jgi:uncharacterized protein
MKLSKEQIHYICEKVLRALKEKNIVEFKTDEAKVLNRMIKEFEKNIDDELKLENDVKTALQPYESQIKSGEVNYNKMFTMIKNKMAKERGFVL